MNELRQGLVEMKTHLDSRLTELFHLLSPTPNLSKKPNPSLASASSSSSSSSSSEPNRRRHHKRRQGSLIKSDRARANGVAEEEDFMMDGVEEEGEEEEEEEEERTRERRRKRRRVEDEGRNPRGELSEVDPLPRLPVEVWTHILSFLVLSKRPFASIHTALLTCRLWRKVCMRLWLSSPFPLTHTHTHTSLYKNKLFNHHIYIYNRSAYRW